MTGLIRRNRFLYPAEKRGPGIIETTGSRFSLDQRKIRPTVGNKSYIVLCWELPLRVPTWKG